MAKAEDYVHQEEKAIQRPDIGVQTEFRDRRPARTYRYDSSLDPTLNWDEQPERALVEWLIELIKRAVTEDEAVVFAKPQVWQGRAGIKVESLAMCLHLLENYKKPFLDWAGKAERHEITVPTLPLFKQEWLSTKAILETVRSRKAAGTSFDLFANQQLDIADQLSAYEYEGPWMNRLILGDSLQVMNSLLEYERLGGQVQMIYMDPPYGVKFGSNFQPFVRRRDVAHGKDEDMIREPETVKAYRDTWELGLHSYLTYLRDRLLIARDLLTDSGSIFVQISDENLHHVREVMDEVFGAENFISLITFTTTASQTSALLSSVSDYLIFYAKSKTHIKYNQIYISKDPQATGGWGFNYIEETNGLRRPLSREERSGIESLPDGKLYRLDNLTSQGSTLSGTIEFEFNGKKFHPGFNNHWKTTISGMKQLSEKDRIQASKNQIQYVRFFDDFPIQPLGNLWTDTTQAGFIDSKLYAVQTVSKVIERCLLMTTDPGDIVLDPTCGSGTTAYVAEQWGRRWITCDTSRVPLALTRQRLLTATFPYYQLKDPKRGPASGFVYKRKQNRKGEEIGGLVPHITLKSIANNEEPEIKVLVDRPEVLKNVTRVTGPFFVESTIPPAADLDLNINVTDPAPTYSSDPNTHIERMIEVLRRSQTLQLPGNQKLTLNHIQRLIDTEHLHAAATEPDSQQRIAILFGPQDGAVSADSVFEAHREAYSLGYNRLYIFAFAFQAKARELASGKLRLPCHCVDVTPDVIMSDLLKTNRASEIFSITGLPDIDLQALADGLYQVEIKGLDIFHPSELKTEAIPAHELPAWMLDADYNGLCFCASQVFFPKTTAWDNISRALKAEYDASVWEHFAGTISEPFTLGKHKRIAVKVIDERGNELMIVREIK